MHDLIQIRQPGSRDFLTTLEGEPGFAIGYQSVSWNALVANINRELTCG